MRQIFILLVAAMMVAFTLSWASPRPQQTYLLPDEISVPTPVELWDHPEIHVRVGVSQNCAKIEEILQEVRDHRIIFGIRAKELSEQSCEISHQQLNLKVSEFTPAKHLDIYFRVDEDSLKYYGTIDLEKELLSKN